MSILQDLGITVGKNKKVAQIFEGLHPDFWQIKYKKPSEYISRYWNLYVDARGVKNVEEEDGEKKNGNSSNGKIFEYILATLLIREDILPIYLNAKVAFVPNVNYDIMLYTAERGPVCISAKTSLRERYKQADLEAIALKYVHRRALAYLLTLDANEAKSVKAKIKSGDVIGLDDVIVATSPEFDAFIASLKTLVYSDPPTVKVIESNQIITREKVAQLNKSTN